MEEDKSAAIPDEGNMAGGSGDDENDDDAINEQLGDRTLAMTLRQAMKANCQIEGLSAKLVE